MLMSYIYLEQPSPGGDQVERSLRAMRHLPKVGRPRYIRGYTYHNAAGTVREAVVVRGDLGSVRFVGFSWGRDSEGSRGLNELFARLCVAAVASTIAGPGERWRIDLERGKT